MNNRVWQIDHGNCQNVQLFYQGSVGYGKATSMSIKTAFKMFYDNIVLMYKLYILTWLTFSITWFSHIGISKIDAEFPIPRTLHANR